ncbi:hypothetical protein E2C01_061688 [Portunus trituberculatus]|uniref:Uncharacterized protein n=1 Tax=Portunus trituberculatus TaxID=210409 RepID=A0A5B7H4J1_PORTR|nr:hypothetical protein [Portunus trituberculatus]
MATNTTNCFLRSVREFVCQNFINYVSMRDYIRHRHDLCTTPAEKQQITQTDKRDRVHLRPGQAASVQLVILQAD